MPDFGRWNATGGDPSLNEINRTDRFLDALAGQEPVYSTDPGDAELAQLLAGWRDEIRTPPLMRPVTPRDAAAALTRAVDARKRTRMSLTLVGSVAAAALCIGGFGAVVASSGPGDALYGLHTALFGEQTRTDQVTLASQQLAEVQQLIDEGQWQAAQDKLEAVTTTVATVNDVEQKQELVTQWQELTVKVDAKDAAATLPPGAPPPPMPEPVVVAPDSNTATTETSTSSETSSGTTSPSSTETTPPSSSPSSSTTTTSVPTSSSPAAEPPPPTGTPTTTTTSPPSTTTTTTTTTTTHAVTTTTTTAQVPIAGPPAGGDSGSTVGGGAQVVAPPTVVPSEAPRQRPPESPMTQGPAAQNPVTQSPETQATVIGPVTTTTWEIPPPKKRGDGE